MTIGQKIKLLRAKVGLTQLELARVIGVHPVTIRKYETDKMQPQLPQIKKLAEVLLVSVNAFITEPIASMIQLETVGDLMGLIIMLTNLDVIQIDGERGDDQALKRESLRITFSRKNPLYKLFDVQVKSGENDMSMELNNVAFRINNSEIVERLIKWERVRYSITKLDEANREVESASFQEEIERMRVEMEMAELVLQRSPIMLDRIDGQIVVKLIPDIKKYLE